MKSHPIPLISTNAPLKRVYCCYPWIRYLNITHYFNRFHKAALKSMCCPLNYSLALKNCALESVDSCESHRYDLHAKLRLRFFKRI